MNTERKQNVGEGRKRRLNTIAKVRQKQNELPTPKKPENVLDKNKVHKCGVFVFGAQA